MAQNLKRASEPMTHTKIRAKMERPRTPMMAFSSAMVTCLARSTACTTCCWCYKWRSETEYNYLLSSQSRTAFPNASSNFSYMQTGFRGSLYFTQKPPGGVGGTDWQGQVGSLLQSRNRAPDCALRWGEAAPISLWHQRCTVTRLPLTLTNKTHPRPSHLLSLYPLFSALCIRSLKTFPSSTYF